MRFQMAKTWRTVVLGLLAGGAAAALVDSAGPQPVHRAPSIATRPAPPATSPIPSVVSHNTEEWSQQILLCQGLSPAAPRPVPYKDCVGGPCGPECQMLDPLEFQKYAQGEYVGRARLPHVPEYRLRVDDQLDFIYRLTREETREPYELNVGDEIRVESFTDKNLDRTLVIQPDGTITLPLLGQVRAGQHTVTDLRNELEEAFKKYYKVPSIIVTPIKMNTQLDDLRNAIGGRSGLGPQVRPGKVTPEGTVQLPAVGTVPAQGLTLREFKAELDARYNALIEGVEVTPVLTVRAPRYAYVLGEVKLPGRYTLEAPTTVMQAVALAGSWNFGANLHQVIIFRRADDWRLIATMLDLRAAFLGRKSCPAAEIWVSDSDLIILPKSHIQLTDNWIEMIFTNGLYRMAPVTGNISYTNLSAFGPVSGT